MNARRKALIAEYKQNPPPAGVVQITNRATGKMFITSGTDAQAKLNSHKAQLTFGSHRNKALQDDWNRFGPEQFSFEVLEFLDQNPDLDYASQEEVTILEDIWLEKLEPYDDRGYNRRLTPH